jgi:integrase
MLVIQGWRIAEVLGLRAGDLHEEAGHKVAVVRGKGGKVLRVPLAAQTWTAVQSWIEAAGIDAGSIFLPVSKGGAVGISVISSQAGWKRVVFLARQAGIERHVHPHILRHTAITLALANGVPLHIVQDFARHEDPRTTRRYDSHRQSLNNQTPHVLAAVLDGDSHLEQDRDQ